MIFNPRQDEFLCDYKYSEVEANKELFPETPSYAEYVRRRQELRMLGIVLGRETGRSPAPTVILPEISSGLNGEKLWDAVTTLQKACRDELAQEILTDVEITIDSEKPFGIVFMSDWHLGGMGTDHEALIRDIELINSCRSLMAYVGGDPIDNFIPEKLSHAGRDSQLVKPGYQWELFRYAIERIRPSLLAVGRGNHDGWTARNSGIEGISQALQGIPVLHTGEDTYIDLTVGKQTYTIYRKHRPIGSSRTNRTAGVKKSYDLGKRLFDVGVTEHHHEAAMSSEMRHGRYRWFITTGSYKIEDPHAAEWGFMHGGIGTPCVVFYPWRHKMVAYMNIEDAIEHLER